jgi:hypothetical protein
MAVRCGTGLLTQIRSRRRDPNLRRSLAFALMFI